MTIRSILELKAQADSTIQDNTIGDITAAEVRNLIKDFLDTMSPAYGAIQCSSVVESITGTPAVIAPFTSEVAATAGYYTTNLTNGSVTRLIGTASLAGATDFIILDGAAEGPNNSSLTVRLYKNGAPTAFDASLTLRGPSNPVGFNFSALSFTGSPGDAVYELRVFGDVASVTFTNLDLIVQAQPVRSFV